MSSLSHRSSPPASLQDLTILPIFQKETETTESIKSEKKSTSTESLPEAPPSPSSFSSLYAKYLNYIHIFYVALILAWWLSSLIKPEKRNQWIITTLLSWSTILFLFFSHVPSSTFGDPIGRLWDRVISKPFFKLRRRVRLGMGWVVLGGLILGSAFGVPLGVSDGGSYRSRGIPVFGLVVFQTGLWITSEYRNQVNWHTVIVGLAFQQIIALFVLKTSTGYDIFEFLSSVLAKYLNFSAAGVKFFFSEPIFNQHYFFINVSAVIIFFIACIYLLYHIGAMQFLISKFAWFFSKTMDVSGVEAIVAAASPFIGQGESACLVKPYVPEMTASEMHVVFTSGFSTISGSTLAVYLNLGIPANFLLTASIMSIPASISISKLRYPETGNPLTKGRCMEVTDPNPADSAIQAFSNGAWFGLKIAGLIIANVLVILSLVAGVDSVLTWWGGFFGIEALTLELIFQYQQDILQVSRLLGIKFIQNEFVAYEALLVLQAAGTLTTLHRNDLRVHDQRRAAANEPSTSKPLNAQQKASAANKIERASREKVLDRDLKITKTSTASIGKFDVTGEGENKEKNIKRKFESTALPSSTERTASMAILTKSGQTQSNKKNKVFDDAPLAGRRDDLINSRKAIKGLKGERG